LIEVLRCRVGCQTINGGSGDDRITAAGRGDTLIGGKGADIFDLYLGRTADTILDFGGKDAFVVRNGYGFNNADRANFLVSSADPMATSAQGQFLYDTDDGRLLYDTGAGAAVHIFALTSRPALKASHFVFDF
jgi:Ca2+-binding RTX toxin-like protein